MSKPRLIGFKTCPFAQRSALLLHEKGIDFDQEYVNPEEPPLWFVEISPSGKVPVLDIDGTAIFESAVISEYINEVNPPSIHPEDALTRATNRVWVEYTSPIYMNIFKWIMADNKKDSTSAKESLEDKLEGLEDALKNTPYFNGNDFSMVDIAAAPIAVRLAIIKELSGVDILENLPKLQAWFATILEREAVTASYPAELKDILAMRMRGNQSYLLES